mmetsp:Transcript_31728/g.67495  ORF Transcript_31728/g.67495 Transcript_31728/m.67495 type:complete len:190 (-) Transcript_31728:177-746(-)|eukprot:CAMPEP_0180470598 /NCGR_PEP_ID=MMETSP1036_2-20121128/28670_1 /TAXON_ID=632150 /ORGANISM="Azadinium spinosum, Strain 3D9" /LENGTH=189 /DNA_ID=CAMNT_0022477741 /DNA_START=50 /DNA_END=619 /DNA_ORIENTATION=+
MHAKCHLWHGGEWKVIAIAFLFVTRSNSQPSSTTEKMYMLVATNVDWHQAKQACEDRGGRLPCVESQAENDIIGEQFQHANIWVGLTRSSVDSEWQWSANCPSTFSMWDGGQGVEGPEHCAGMQPERFGHNMWHDYHCTGEEADTFSAVCEFGASTTTRAPEPKKCMRLSAAQMDRLRSGGWEPALCAT